MVGPRVAPLAGELAPDELHLLLRVSRRVAGQHEAGSLLAAVAEEVRGVLPTDRVLLWLPEEGERGTARLCVQEEARASDRTLPLPPDGSPLATVHREGATLVFATSEELRALFPSPSPELGSGHARLALAPLVAGRRRLGALGFQGREPGAPPSSALLAEIGAAVAASISMEREREEQERRARESAAVLEIHRAIGRHLERDELFGALAQTLRGIVAMDRFGIEVPLEGDRLRGHLVTPVGDTVAPTTPHVLPAPGTACDWVIRNRDWLVLAQREELRERFPTTHGIMQREGMQALCVLPLEADGHCRAALFFMASDPGAYASLSRGLLEQVASTVAVALDHSMAYEQVRHLRDQLAAENAYLQEEIRKNQGMDEIVGRSGALGELMGEIQRVAPTDVTVLVQGETGTGKELVARAIHEKSRRHDRPLVKVNCAAIAAGLVESELFGHVKGAFTGALTSREGRFKLADGGTLFLDEVGELPLDTQVKLLRVLQEREFEPIGSDRTERVDVRVIAATNRDLGTAVAEGSFRADLYYRLNVFPLHVPPLRERLEDVPLLAAFFLQRFAKRLGRPELRIPDAAMRRLQGYAWPGNVRELQNLVERAAILSPGAELELDETRVLAAPREAPAPLPADDGEVAGDGAGPGVERELEAVERDHILATLRRTGWVVEGTRGAARSLGLHPSTLRSRMKKLGIVRATHDIS